MPDTAVTTVPEELQPFLERRLLKSTPLSWWNSPSDKFGGQSPSEVWASGESGRVKVRATVIATPIIHPVPTEIDELVPESIKSNATLLEWWNYVICPQLGMTPMQFWAQGEEYHEKVTDLVKWMVKHDTLGFHGFRAGE